MTKRKTKEQFIKDAQSIHGLRYGYNNAKYVNGLTKVLIDCPAHGGFWQTPGNHLRGVGCPKCANVIKANSKRSINTKFVEQAQSVHNFFYNYDNTKYVNCKTPLLINCPIHGDFWQSPNNHLQGKGCAECGKQSTRKPQEQFIHQAQLIHGSRYDYSHLEYLNSRTKVCINCLIHGEFRQMPGRHLRGRGCPKCAKQTTANKKRLTTETFIKKAQSIHTEESADGTRVPLYSYGDVNYKDSHTKVLINCRIHGGFWQVPNTHLSGHGCLECANILIADKRRFTTEEFIQKAESIHGEKNAEGVLIPKYSYNNIVYKNINIKILIDCPTHGGFWQIPAVHLRGSGCRFCSPSGFEYEQPAILYLLKIEKPFATFWKIGITNQTIKERFRNDYCYIKEQTTWEFLFGYDAYRIEQSTLTVFAEYKFDEFLFDLLRNGGNTECFEINLPKRKVIQYINRQIKELESNQNTSDCS